MFRVVTEAVGAQLIKVPLDADWNVPLEALLAAVGDPSVGVVWLCSPNNPTGRLLSPEVVAAVLEAAPDVVGAVDEAYAGTSGESLAPLMRGAPNGAPVR